ncbi:hypothetical protein [Brachyspira aalborgi]|uniref:Lipoprotein n=1 Tax=Brachyspira aalborgi TaxID=29522 RepID=A0A5C8FQI9_9SPIR|nr:hypothetical protein [Brachyspira aalborgi]TXJ51731.1 hypothetical protein EPJ84_02990 [Brachyspira aalborgi]
MRKYFYILITLLAVLSIGFVGCKNKPTAVADFIDEANKVTGGTDFNPMGEIKGYGGYNFSDYAGNFFWSVKEYYKSGSSGEKFRYSLEIKKSGVSTIAEVKGYSEGKAFTKSYTGGNKTTDNQGDKFAFGYGGNNIRFNSDKKHALLTADGLNNLKLAVSNKSN